jgi:hypothetical protein
MEKTTLDYLLSKPSAAWKDKVKKLPQFAGIPDEVSSLWIERASGMEPDDRDRLISYMGRLDADDLGAMIAHNRHRWHPHTTPTSVVRTKLLHERPKSEPAYKARRRSMTPIAREMLLKKIDNETSQFRNDLTEKVCNNTSANHHWLSSKVADIIEENGRKILIEYRTPSEPLSLLTRGISFHHEVSMHYALLAAREAGIKVDGLRMCALDAKAWSVETLDLPINEELVAEIRAEGDRVWNDHIKPAQLIPSALPRGIASLEDLRANDASGSADQLDLVAKRFLAWGVAEKECQSECRDLQTEAADLLPFAALPLEVDMVDAGAVRFRIDRKFDMDGLAAIAKDLLIKRQGYSAEDAQAVLDQPNYWNAPEYSSHGLIQAMETHFDLDPTNDPRFSMAIAFPRERRADTLLDLIRSLDAEDSISLENYVRSGRMEMEMVTPRARFEREARAAASEGVRHDLRQILDTRTVAPPEPPKRGGRRP